MTGPTDVCRVVILGGGLTGLTTAFRLDAAFRGQGRKAQITVLERAERLGGKVQTLRRDGFTIEAGPEGFVAAAPEGMALCREVGLGDTLISPHRSDGGSSIFLHGRLHPVTQGVADLLPLRPGALLSEGVLSPAGALRAMLEAHLPPAPNGRDQPLASFMRRRFGQEAWENVLEPLMGGIAGGEGETLSAMAAAPGLVGLERQYGSVTRGARVQKARLDDLGKAGGALAAPREGMDIIISRLESALRESPALTIRTGTPARTIHRQPGGYVIETGGSDGALTADVVVVTLPAVDAAGPLRSLDPALATLLGEIRFRSMATYSFAFRAGDAPKILAGTGYVKHQSERGPVNAVTWDSVRWPGHAPEGMALLRTFISHDQTVESTGDAELIALGRDEIRRVLKVTADPLFVEGRRWSPALPRYTLGHLDRLATAEERLRMLPGLILAGVSYRGRGVTDAIRSGTRAAEIAAGTIVGAIA